jgi:hypothetical protein
MENTRQNRNGQHRTGYAFDSWKFLVTLPSH